MRKIIDKIFIVLFSIISLASSLYLYIILTCVFPASFEDRYYLSKLYLENDVWNTYNFLYVRLEVVFWISVIITAALIVLSLLKFKKAELIRRLSIAASVLAICIGTPLFMMFFYGKGLDSAKTIEVLLFIISFLGLQSLPLYLNIKRLLNL